MNYMFYSLFTLGHITFTRVMSVILNTKEYEGTAQDVTQEDTLDSQIGRSLPPQLLPKLILRMPSPS